MPDPAERAPMLAANQAVAAPGSWAPPVDLSFAALYAVRARLAGLSRKVADRHNERHRLDIAMKAGQRASATPDPTTVRLLRDAIGNAASAFEARLLAFGQNPTEEAAAELIDGDAAVYFVRDHMLAKVPDVVLRLLPDAAAARVAAERQAEIATVEADLTRLWQLREEVRAALGVEVRVVSEWRQVGYTDARIRVACERELEDLKVELAALNRDQDLLRQRRPDGPAVYDQNERVIR